MTLFLAFYAYIKIPQAAKETAFQAFNTGGPVGIKQLFQVFDLKTLKDNDLLHLALRKYQRRRISQAKETSEMMTFLHELFKDDKFIKKPIRNFGLNLINQLPFKKWLIGQAGS